jgi:flavin reductase (DIM6/NTAB) family NADH-FMN oxidoreductase RutF
MADKERREVLRLLPHGLQVVTVRDGDEFHGYTSSWMTQASFTPPLLMLGVRGDSRSRKLMRKSGVFCVHFLGKDQEEIAQRFFKTAEHAGDKLAGLDYEIGEKTGCPVLVDLLAYAECRVVHEWSGGDHDVVVGEVLAAKMLRPGKPLTLGDTPWQYGG